MPPTTAEMSKFAARVHASPRRRSTSASSSPSLRLQHLLQSGLHCEALVLRESEALLEQGHRLCKDVELTHYVLERRVQLEWCPTRTRTRTRRPGRRRGGATGGRLKLAFPNPI